MIEKLNESAFTVSKPFSVGPLEIGVRATILKLKQGLLIYSPVDLSDEEVREIKALGSVKWIVAPNTEHYLFLDKARLLFSEAKILIANGLRKKLENVSKVVDIDQFDELTDELEVIPIGGMPGLEETVIFHKASKSLLVADLFFNLQNVRGFFPWMLTKMFGTYNRPAISKLLKMKVKDTVSFEKSLMNLNNLDFQNVIMSHGEPIIGNHQVIRKLITDSSITIPK